MGVRAAGVMGHGTLFGGSKQYTCMGILRDFPYNSAFSGFIVTPGNVWPLEMIGGLSEHSEDDD